MFEKHGSQPRLERNGKYKNRDTDKVKKFDPKPKVYYDEDKEKEMEEAWSVSSDEEDEAVASPPRATTEENT